MKRISFFLAILFSFYGCQPSSQNQKIGEEFVIGDETFAIDTILVSSSDNLIDTTAIMSVDVKSLKLDTVWMAFATAYTEFTNLELEDSLGTISMMDVMTSNPGVIPIPEEYQSCMSSAPTGIKELKDGVIVDAYDFYKGDEAKLGFLGFFNVNMKEDEKITVVEFSQNGSKICNNNILKYGVGARLMMRVTRSKRNAKLETPQQITASVIFGQADVKFSMRTFGITGPGVARLNKVGTVTENTYSSFMAEISHLIVEVYQDNSEYIITPQPLFLKQN